jgi:hypothetical protein
MNSRTRVVVALGALVIGTSILVQAGPEESALRSALGEQLYTDCGLSKLDLSEQQQLLGFVDRQVSTSYLAESAIRMMEEDGWEPVTVLGLVKTRESGGDYHVLARHHGRLYTLRPSIIPHLPDPGVYWADFVASHWDILYPNGEEGSFSATELK